MKPNYEGLQNNWRKHANCHFLGKIDTHTSFAYVLCSRSFAYVLKGSRIIHKHAANHTTPLRHNACIKCVCWWTMVVVAVAAGAIFFTELEVYFPVNRLHLVGVSCLLHSIYSTFVFVCFVYFTNHWFQLLGASRFFLRCTATPVKWW